MSSSIFPSANFEVAEWLSIWLVNLQCVKELILRPGILVVLMAGKSSPSLESSFLAVGSVDCSEMINGGPLGGIKIWIVRAAVYGLLCLRNGGSAQVPSIYRIGVGYSLLVRQGTGQGVAARRRKLLNDKKQGLHIDCAASTSYIDSYISVRLSFVHESLIRPCFDGHLGTFFI